MSNPTWQNLLASVLTNSERPLQLEIPRTVAVTLPEGHSWEGLEYRLSKLEALVAALQTAHQSSLRIILVFIDLRLQFLADSSIAKLLRACGIEDCMELSGQDTRELHERMERENKKRRLVDSVPRVEQLESWAQAAKLASELDPSCGRSGAADS